MRIVIINPNSDSAQTAQIDRAAKAFAADRFEVVTLATPGAPQYIDTCMDAAKALPGMLALVEQWEEKADAYVIACHCDPNLTILREASAHPVLGIGEASFYLAAMLGDSFSVISTGVYSNPNKVNLIRSYHMEQHFASIRNPEGVGSELERYIRAGRRCMEEDGAEVIILGCAGLCQLAEDMTAALGVPVLDGVVCALSVAEGMVHAGLKTSKFRYYSAGK